MSELVMRVYSEDGSYIDRPYTEKELEEHNAFLEDLQNRKQFEAEVAAKKQAAEEKLASLGLSIDDLKVLGIAETL